VPVGSLIPPVSYWAWPTKGFHLLFSLRWPSAAPPVVHGFRLRVFGNLLDTATRLGTLSAPRVLKTGPAA